MSYPLFTKEPSIRYSKHTKELDSLIQPFAPTAKRKKIKIRKPPNKNYNIRENGTK